MLGLSSCHSWDAFHWLLIELTSCLYSISKRPQDTYFRIVAVLSVPGELWRNVVRCSITCIINFKISLKSYCGRFLLDIYRFLTGQYSPLNEYCDEFKEAKSVFFLRDKHFFALSWCFKNMPIRALYRISLIAKAIITPIELI